MTRISLFLRLCMYTVSVISGVSLGFLSFNSQSILHDKNQGFRLVPSFRRVDTLPCPVAFLCIGQTGHILFWGGVIGQQERRL
jgi:hypothetical protein